MSKPEDLESCLQPWYMSQGRDSHMRSAKGEVNAGSLNAYSEADRWHCRTTTELRRCGYMNIHCISWHSRASAIDTGCTGSGPLLPIGPISFFFSAWRLCRWEWDRLWRCSALFTCRLQDPSRTGRRLPIVVDMLSSKFAISLCVLVVAADLCACRPLFSKCPRTTSLVQGHLVRCCSLFRYDWRSWYSWKRSISCDLTYSCRYQTNLRRPVKVGRQ